MAATVNLMTKRESNNNFASLPRLPDAVSEVLQKPNSTEAEQQEHGWNPKDCSQNIRVDSRDHRVITRDPVADSTDGVRGKKSYRSGIHIWEIIWPTDQRGSHAVVGVATTDEQLHTKHYCPLVGNSPNSWGWNIVAKQLELTNDSEFSTTDKSQSDTPVLMYPPHLEAGQTDFKVPERFLMILDMSEGTLAFSVGGVYLGVAFHRLEGRTLYPMISAVWGNARIQLRYRGGNVHPSSLAGICRMLITERTKDHHTHIDSLPLPNRLKEYLMYRI